MKQLYMPGFAPAKRSTDKRSHKAKRADLVLVQALDARSTPELESALEALKQLDDPALEPARLLVTGVLAYRIARDGKQMELFS